MKLEQKQLIKMLEPLLVAVIFGVLYSIAGSGDFWGGQKWLRRFLGPGLFCLWAFLRSGFDWIYLAQMPFMMGALCLPYGADTISTKIFLRGIFGLANGTAVSIRNAFLKKWALVAVQVTISIAVLIGLGVWNETPNAMIEQFLIGFIIVLIPVFTISKRE